ncbi:hypothetical protein NFJ02_26g60200 [Pycnococcus provasolii]
MNVSGQTPPSTVKGRVSAPAGLEVSLKYDVSTTDSTGGVSSMSRVVSDENLFLYEESELENLSPTALMKKKAVTFVKGDDTQDTERQQQQLHDSSSAAHNEPRWSDGHINQGAAQERRTSSVTTALVGAKIAANVKTRRKSALEIQRLILQSTQQEFAQLDQDVKARREFKARAQFLIVIAVKRFLKRLREKMRRREEAEAAKQAVLQAEADAKAARQAKIRAEIEAALARENAEIEEQRQREAEEKQRAEQKRQEREAREEAERVAAAKAAAEAKAKPKPKAAKPVPEPPKPAPKEPKDVRQMYRRPPEPVRPGRHGYAVGNTLVDRHDDRGFGGAAAFKLDDATSTENDASAAVKDDEMDVPHADAFSLQFMPLFLGKNSKVERLAQAMRWLRAASDGVSREHLDALRISPAHARSLGLSEAALSNIKSIARAIAKAHSHPMQHLGAGFFAPASMSADLDGGVGEDLDGEVAAVNVPALLEAEALRLKVFLEESQSLDGNASWLELKNFLDQFSPADDSARREKERRSVSPAQAALRPNTAHQTSQTGQLNMHDFLLDAKLPFAESDATRRFAQLDGGDHPTATDYGYGYRPEPPPTSASAHARVPSRIRRIVGTHHHPRDYDYSASPEIYGHVIPTTPRSPSAPPHLLRETDKDGAVGAPVVAPFAEMPWRSDKRRMQPSTARPWSSREPSKRARQMAVQNPVLHETLIDRNRLSPSIDRLLSSSKSRHTSRSRVLLSPRGGRHARPEGVYDYARAAKQPQYVRGAWTHR